MAQYTELLVYKRAYDFSKWLLGHTGKYPKSYRFSIAVKLEQKMINFLELVMVANRRQDKLRVLQKADETLETIRLLFRLSYDLRFINLKSYQYGCTQLVEIGKLLGGWIKKPGKIG